MIIIPKTLVYNSKPGQYNYTDVVCLFQMIINNSSPTPPMIVAILTASVCVWYFDIFL